MGGWRCIYFVYSGNVPRKGVWGTELYLETVEHLPKPQGRLHWESYDLILFQQGSLPGPGRDELLRISTRGSTFVSRGTQAGTRQPGAASRNFLGLFSGREAAGKPQTESTFQLVFLGTKPKGGCRKGSGMDCEGLDGRGCGFEFGPVNVALH